MTDRIKLAEELEAAEGGSRSLDIAIRGALQYNYNPKYPYGLPPFTSSIDAAMLLVPEGWALNGLCQLNDMSGQAAIRRLSDCKRAGGTAATPALALCAAALKAGE